MRKILFVAAIVLLSGAVQGQGVDAGSEQAALHIFAAAKNPPIDADVYDKNMDGIVDRYNFRLLDAVISDPGAPHHDVILGIWALNYAQIKHDNTLGDTCTYLPVIAGFSCDDAEKFGAAIVTIGDPVAIDDTLKSLAMANIHIDLNNYNTTARKYLAADGDLDGDGYTNLVEYQSVCGNGDNFIAAALDPSLTPLTVPCCKGCPPLVITEQPTGADKYSEDSWSFSVASTGGQGLPHYHWYRDFVAIGNDAPTLDLIELLPGDSGTYRCEISDEIQTVISDRVKLNVANHMSFLEQPGSAALQPGDSYTLSVRVTDGLGTLQFQWLRDATPIGTSRRLVLPAVTSADAGTYHCEISDEFETVVSDPAVISVAVAEGEGEGATEGEGEGESGGEGEGESGGEGEGEGEGEGGAEGEGEGGAEGEGEGATEGEVEGAAEGEGEGGDEGEGESGALSLGLQGSVWDFGIGLVAQPHMQRLRITNTGTAYLSATASLQDAQAFTIPGDSIFNLEPGESADLIVQIIPQAPEVYTDVLTLTDDNEVIAVYLKGTGIVFPILACAVAPGHYSSAARGDVVVLLFVGVALTFPAFRNGRRRRRSH